MPTLLSPHLTPLLLFHVQFAALLLLHFATCLLPEHTLPRSWPRLGRARSSFAGGLEGLLAAGLLLYTGGVALTGFSDTLLHDPRFRVPFFVSAWLLTDMHALAIAKDSAGKGTWTALATWPLSLLTWFAGMTLFQLEGELQIRFIGSVFLLLWTCPLLALIGTQHRALWLLVFAGWPVFVLSHVVLVSIGVMTPACAWLDAAGDAALQSRFLAGVAHTCSFQSISLFACIWATPRLPRHLPHEHPKQVPAHLGISPSSFVLLTLTGLAVAIAYQNVVAEKVSFREFLRPSVSISAGSGRDLLSRLPLLSESATDRAALWGVLAAFSVGALLVAARVRRGSPRESLVAEDGTGMEEVTGKRRGKRKAQNSAR